MHNHLCFSYVFFPSSIFFFFHFVAKLCFQRSPQFNTIFSAPCHHFSHFRLFFSPPTISTDECHLSYWPIYFHAFKLNMNASIDSIVTDGFRVSDRMNRKTESINQNEMIYNIESNLWNCCVKWLYLKNQNLFAHINSVDGQNGGSFNAEFN